MKYANVFYVPHINVIGGIETFLYELITKYKDEDITIAYTNEKSDYTQIKRYRKYARVIKTTNEKIKCKRLFISYQANIDLFEADEIIYLIHADYKAQKLLPNNDERIDKYYAVSKAAAKSYEEISGKKVEVCYNPLTIEEPKRVLKLISATRLTKEKGLDRMKILIKLLEENNIPFIWLIFTNKTDAINNPNVIYMKPRLDIRGYIKEADYLVQLSDCEAMCYSVCEALELKTPVIVTDLEVFKELGIENRKHGYKLGLDMKNAPIKDIYNNIPKEFNFKTPKDIYNKLLLKDKKTYNGEKQVYVKALKSYYDIEEQENKTINSKKWKVSVSRAEELINNPKGALVEICK